jgi:excisionase family DNA binding protein
MIDLISTKEASEKLGLSIRRVQALITSGRLPAQKIGNSYVIEEKNLKLVRERKPGRPSKNEND